MTLANRKLDPEHRNGLPHGRRAIHPRLQLALKANHAAGHRRRTAPLRPADRNPRAAKKVPPGDVRCRKRLASPFLHLPQIMLPPLGPNQPTAPAETEAQRTAAQASSRTTAVEVGIDSSMNLKERLRGSINMGQTFGHRFRRCSTFIGFIAISWVALSDGPVDVSHRTRSGRLLPRADSGPSGHLEKNSSLSSETRGARSLGAVEGQLSAADTNRSVSRKDFAPHNKISSSADSTKGRALGASVRNSQLLLGDRARGSWSRGLRSCCGTLAQAISFDRATRERHIGR